MLEHIPLTNNYWIFSAYGEKGALELKPASDLV